MYRYNHQCIAKIVNASLKLWFLIFCDAVTWLKWGSWNLQCTRALHFGQNFLPQFLDSKCPWDTPQNLGNGKLQPKICRAVLQFCQVRFHSLAISWSLLGVVWSCREVLGLVRSLLGVCWDLSGVVGTCQEFVGTCQECHLAKPS